MRIWRDIPTVGGLVQIMGSATSIDSQQHAKSKSRFKRTFGVRSDKKYVQVQDPLFTRVSQVMNNYHNITKDRLLNFASRINLLKDLIRLIDHDLSYKLVEQLGRAMGHHRVLSRRNQGLSKEFYYAALAKRAAAKAAYLEILQDYYRHDSGQVADPGVFMMRLQAKRQQAENGDLIGLSGGCRLEAWDPIHRNWEMDMSQSGDLTGDQMVPHQEEAINWFNAVRAGTYDEPLFVYLEATTHCTDKATASGSVSVIFRSGAADKDSPFFVLRITNLGTVQMARMDSGDGDGLVWSVFDTTDLDRSMSRKGFYAAKPSLAYNWTKNGEILAGYHNASGEGAYGAKSKDVHHSSFTGGKLIRCAGMIAGQGGKVTYVDNDSGHYKPPTANLHKFVGFLYRNNVLSADARVLDKSQHEDEDGVPARDFYQHPTGS